MCRFLSNQRSVESSTRIHRDSGETIYKRYFVNSVNVLSQICTLEGQSDVSSGEISLPFRMLHASCPPYPEIKIRAPIGPRPTKRVFLNLWPFLLR